jgi:hypothetical protein
MNVTIDALQAAIRQTVESCSKPVTHRGVFERLPGLAPLQRIAVNMNAMEGAGLLKLLPPTKGPGWIGEEKLYTI